MDWLNRTVNLLQSEVGAVLSSLTDEDEAMDPLAVKVGDAELQTVSRWFEQPANAQRLFMAYPRAELTEADLELSASRMRHAAHMLDLFPALQQLRYELCPAVLSEAVFWGIYFGLVTEQRQGAAEGADEKNDRVCESRQQQQQQQRRRQRRGAAGGGDNRVEGAAAAVRASPVRPVVQRRSARLAATTTAQQRQQQQQQQQPQPQPQDEEQPPGGTESRERSPPEEDAPIVAEDKLGEAIGGGGGGGGGGGNEIGGPTGNGLPAAAVPVVDAAPVPLSGGAGGGGGGGGGSDATNTTSGALEELVVAAAVRPAALVPAATATATATAAAAPAAAAAEATAGETKLTPSSSSSSSARRVPLAVVYSNPSGDVQDGVIVAGSATAVPLATLVAGRKAFDGSRCGHTAAATDDDDDGGAAGAAPVLTASAPATLSPEAGSLAHVEVFDAYFDREDEDDRCSSHITAATVAEADGFELV